MKLPIYFFPRKFPKYMITPVSISKMKWGNIEVQEDGGIIQNIFFKTVMVTDVMRSLFNIFLVLFIAASVYVIAMSVILFSGMTS